MGTLEPTTKEHLLSMNDKVRVTIRDVALASGVSYPAVSVVLNEKKDSRIRVSEETRARILKTAADLGYVPNLAARALKGYKKSLIAVFTYEKVFPVDFKNEFYQFFAGIEQEAEKSGFDLLILNNRPGKEGFHEQAHSRIFTADGAVMIGIDRDDEGIGHLVRNGFPLVFVGRRTLAGQETNWITFDYRQGIEKILRHLNERGCSRLHYVRRDGPQREPQLDRERFVAELSGSCGFPTFHTHIIADAYRDLSDFGIVNSKDCVLFDHMATARLFCGRHEFPLFPDGKRVLSAVAEDNWSDSNAHWTRLSNERVELGRSTVRVLVDIVEGLQSQPVQKLIPMSFIASESTAYQVPNRPADLGT